MKRFLATFALAAIQANVFALVPTEEYHLHMGKKNGKGTCRLACVVAIQPDLVATIIPARFATSKFSDNLSINAVSDEKKSTHQEIPCHVFSRERLTGLALIKLETPLSGNIPKSIPSQELKRATPIIYKTLTGELINGVYVGIEHSSSSISFPLPLLRIQFPALKTPLLGQSCYTNNGELVGLVVDTTPQNICFILPAEAIDNLAKSPNSKRMRLGCFLDINGSIPEIIHLVEGGPMQKGGVKNGDIIVSINDIPINNYKDFLKFAYYQASQAPLNIKIIRKNQLIEIKGIIPEEEPR